MKTASFVMYSAWFFQSYQIWSHIYDIWPPLKATGMFYRIWHTCQLKLWHFETTLYKEHLYSFLTWHMITSNDLSLAQKALSFLYLMQCMYVLQYVLSPSLGLCLQDFGKLTHADLKIMTFPLQHWQKAFLYSLHYIY